MSESHFHPIVMLVFGRVVKQFFWDWEMDAATFLQHVHPDVAWNREAAIDLDHSREISGRTQLGPLQYPRAHR